MKTERWWNRDEVSSEDVASRLWPLAIKLRSGQGEERRQAYEDALALYEGNGSGVGQSFLGALSLYGPEPPSANVIQYCTDTMAAHIMRNKVRPLFVTEKGDAALKEKAEGMQLAVEAGFKALGIYGEEGAKICQDGLLCDAGGMKFSPDYTNLRVCGERVFAWEVYVSEREAARGKPRQMIHMTSVDRSVLLDLFKDDAPAIEAIEGAPNTPPGLMNYDDWAIQDDEISDQILVGEAWHLPSGKVDRKKPEAFGKDAEGNEITPSHDGRRVMFIEGHTLLDEAWPYDYFPIAWFKPMPKSRGYWSRSIPETLAGEQLALNRMNTRVDGIMNLHARPLLLLWKKARIKPSRITNGWANILESDVQPGSAAMYVSPQSVPAEYLGRIREIIGWGEKKVGLSEMSINAQKPPGIDHAPGLQHLQDTESVRHTPKFNGWERFHVHAARCIVDLYRLLAEEAKRRKENFKLVWESSKLLRRIDWSDVDLEEERFRISVWPTNILPQTPAAKASRAAQYYQDGIFTREQFLEIVDAPDLGSAIGDLTAARENIERRIEDLIQGKRSYEECAPHAWLELEMAKTIAASRINRLEADGEPDEKIDPVRRFYEDCAKLSSPPSPPPGPASGGPEGGVPAAPPGAEGPPGLPMGVGLPPPGPGGAMGAAA